MPSVTHLYFSVCVVGLTKAAPSVRGTMLIGKNLHQELYFLSLWPPDYYDAFASEGFLAK